MRIVLTTIICATTLAACSSAESSARDAVLEALKDPESARFGDFSIVDGTEGRGACLVVNAKNSMGGYTGDQLAMLAKDQEGNWRVLDIDEKSFDWCESMVKADLSLSATDTAQMDGPEQRSAAWQKCVDDATDAVEAAKCSEIK